MTLSLSGNVVGQDGCPASLIHYWNLESNDGGFDNLINGLAAEVVVATTPVIGIVNTGQYFTGLSELNIPDDPTFDWRKDESFTLEFWINKSSKCPVLSSTYNNVVIGRDDPDSELHWWAGVNCLNPGKIVFTLNAIDGEGLTIQGKKDIIDGRWHHVAIVRDGNEENISLYVDGVRDTIAAFSYNVGFLSEVPVTVGWINLGAKYHLDASIDELAVYNNDISESTIIEHYNNGNGMDYCTGEVTGIQEITNESDVDFKVSTTVAASELHVGFKLNHAQPVQLSVYDVAGRRISDLLNEKLDMGQHDFVFNISSLDKNSVVLVKLQLANNVVTRKVVIR